jgi:hypothetical protein
MEVYQLLYIAFLYFNMDSFIQELEFEFVRNIMVQKQKKKDFDEKALNASINVKKEAYNLK